MADEVQTGTAPVVTPVTVFTAPATEQAPQETKPTPAAPVGTGKTLEEYAREAEEKDRYISEVNERAARAEHEAQLTRNLVEQFASGREREPEKPAVPEISDDEWTMTPGKAASRLVNESLRAYREQDKAEHQRERVEQYVGAARTAYESGKAEALKSNPGVFRGIETAIANEVLATVQGSLKAGQPVDVASLRDSKFWEAAAVAYRISQGEDLLSIASKYYPARTNAPMVAGHTETPTAGGVPQAVPTLTEEEKSGARFFGVTDEQWAATKRAEGKK